MATKNKQSIKKPAVEQTPVDTEKGYGGSQDYATGKVQSDPSQATNEQLREDRARQRGADAETGDGE